MLTINERASNQILDSGMDALFNAGRLRIWTGAKPATANLGPTGTLLIDEDPLPADAFAPAAARAKAKNGVWQADGLADGLAGYFRLSEAGDTDALDAAFARIDGRCGTAATLGWATATAYVAGDKRLNNGVTYICTENHTSDADTQPGVGDGWMDVWDTIDMVLNNDDIAVGQPVTVNTFSVTLPGQRY